MSSCFRLFCLVPRNGEGESNLRGQMGGHARAGRAGRWPSAAAIGIDLAFGICSGACPPPHTSPASNQTNSSSACGAILVFQRWIFLLTATSTAQKIVSVSYLFQQLGNRVMFKFNNRALCTLIFDFEVSRNQPNQQNQNRALTL